ncbi:MAG: hypothetical protein AB7O52_05485 [Planctomycetota bacterium]
MGGGRRAGATAWMRRRSFARGWGHTLALVGLAIAGLAIASGCALPAAAPGATRDATGKIALRRLAASAVTAPAVFTTREVVELELGGAGPGSRAAVGVQVSAPGQSEWSRVEPDSSGLLRLPLPVEGCYRLRLVAADASPDTTSSKREGAPESADLQLHVDRTPPSVVIEFETYATTTAGVPGGVQASWTIHDDSPIERVDLWHSSDGGQHWTLVVTNGVHQGWHRWPSPSGRLDGYTLRILARDLAGNLLDQLAPVSGAQPTPAVAPEPGTPETRDARTATPTDEPPNHAVVWFEGYESAGRPRARNGCYAFAGGTRLGVPSALMECELVADPADEGSARAPAETPVTASILALPISAGAVELPSRSGGPFRLRGRIGDADGFVLSPPFFIDAEPPVLERCEITRQGEQIRIDWLAADAATQWLEDPSQPWVRATLALGSGDPLTWEFHPLGSESPVTRLAPTTDPVYYFVQVEDGFGNRSSMPQGPEAWRRVPGVLAGPSPLNFSGESFASGALHTVFIRPGAPEVVASDVVVRVVEVDGDRVLLSDSIAGTATSLSWELPDVSGRFWLELVWTDDRGREQITRPAAPFEIDADPPQLAWRELPEWVRDSVRLRWQRSDGAERVARLDLWRRLAPAAGEAAEPAAAPGWEPILGLGRGPGIGDDGCPHETELDVSAWPEGRWQLGFTATDALGNQTPQPIASPPFEIDRTPPDLSRLELPSRAIEGLPVAVAWAAAETPRSSEAWWLRENAPRERRSVTWERVERRWIGSVAPLAAGRGRLLLELTDAAQNRAERSTELEVRGALTRIEVGPKGPLEAGAPLFVDYEIDPEIIDRGHRLQLLILPLESIETAASASPALAEIELVPQRRQLTWRAPLQPGTYRFALAIDRGLAVPTAAPVVVVRPRDVAPAASLVSIGAPQPGAVVNATERTEASPAPGLDPGSAMIIECKELQNLWQLGESSADFQRRREELLARLQRALIEQPRHVGLRRALARTITFVDRPHYESALWVLRQGLAHGGTPDQLASLWSDLGVLQLQSGQLADAEKSLLEAVALEDGAKRRLLLGRAYELLRDDIRAEIQYRLAAELEPSRSSNLRKWAQSVARLPEAARVSASRTLDAWVRTGKIDPVQRQQLEHLFYANGS